MKIPKVSVIIPTYNRAHFVIEAIESVLNQTFQDFEIIVVDDGSTDNTREALKKFGSKIRYTYQENRGVAAARNTGIRAAKGEFIAFLDHDDLWLPDKLSIQMDAFSKNKEVGLVYTDCVAFDKEGKLPKGDRIRPSGWVFKQLFRRPFGLLTGVVCKKECFNKCGLFNESFFTSDDYDMCLRISTKHKFLFIDQPLFRRRVHSHSLGTVLPMMRLEHKKILEKTYSQFKDSMKISNLFYRKRMSKQCKRIAQDYYNKGDTKKAREFYLKAIKYTPYRINYCFRLAKTYLRPLLTKFYIKKT